MKQKPLFCVFESNYNFSNATEEDAIFFKLYYTKLLQCKIFFHLIFAKEFSSIARISHFSIYKCDLFGTLLTYFFGHKNKLLIFKQISLTFYQMKKTLFSKIPQ